jgi:NRAMP (natural resistance-associated macrophage protein)-like metal ion transporter
MDKRNTMIKSSSRLSRFWKILGPGLVTGASDDDPSGIATYSQAGAAYGLSTLWTALITFPLMASIQEMCARIGLVTSKGLAGTIKTNYSKPVLYLMLLFSFPAIVMNIGADIAGMGAVGNLLFPSIHATFFSIGFTIVLLVLIIYLPYQKIASILKYLCLVLLVYLIVPFLYKQDLAAVLKATFIPTIKLDKDFISILVAILGTTISPYLFFWQATMEVEDKKKMKRDLVVNKRIINEMRKDVDFPIKALIYSAILYGLTAPVLIAIILHISNNKKIMGKNTNGRISNILGFAALSLMTAASIMLIYILLKGK